MCIVQPIHQEQFCIYQNVGYMNKYLYLPQVIIPFTGVNLLHHGSRLRWAAGHHISESVHVRVIGARHVVYSQFFPPFASRWRKMEE